LGKIGQENGIPGAAISANDAVERQLAEVSAGGGGETSAGEASFRLQNDLRRLVRPGKVRIEKGSSQKLMVSSVPINTSSFVFLVRVFTCVIYFSRFLAKQWSNICQMDFYRQQDHLEGQEEGENSLSEGSSSALSALSAAYQRHRRAADEFMLKLWKKMKKRRLLEGETPKFAFEEFAEALMKGKLYLLRAIYELDHFLQGI